MRSRFEARMATPAPIGLGKAMSLLTEMKKKALMELVA